MNKFLQTVWLVGFGVLVGIGIAVALWPEAKCPCPDLEHRVTNAAEGIHTLKSKLQAADDRVSGLEIAHNQLFNKIEEHARRLDAVGALLAAPVIPAKAGIQGILDPGSGSSVMTQPNNRLESLSHKGKAGKAKKQPCAMGPCW